jgi:hypothetical protein
LTSLWRGGGVTARRSPKEYRNCPEPRSADPSHRLTPPSSTSSHRDRRVSCGECQWCGLVQRATATVGA